MGVRTFGSSCEQCNWKTNLGFALRLFTLLVLCQVAFSYKDLEDDVDFEFDDSLPEPNLNNVKNTFKEEGWSQNSLCKNLQCKPHQTCVVKTQNAAVCISRMKLQYNGKSDKALEEDPHLWPEPGSCQPCPVAKPKFVCAADNQTYSSDCRLQYHNCVHKVNYAVLCQGFCPCKDLKSELELQKENKMKERWNSYMSKYQNTLNKVKPKNEGAKNKPLKSLPSSKTGEFDKTTRVSSKGQHKKSCSQEDLKMMGDRLLDWFSVVMADHPKASLMKVHRLNSGRNGGCKVEVKWMFQHLDSNGDSRLSLRELYDLEHDEREQCLQPYLADCDANRDLFLSYREWCQCFEKSKRPCRAARERSPESVNGAYVPQCDDDGYYQPRQCHSSIGMCWCVDKHGVEFTNTRRRGFPDCVSLLKRAMHRNHEDDEGDSYEEQEEGSADRPLDF